MQIFVWRGERVLKNYSSGLVVIAASSVEDAWARLAQHDVDTYWRLKTGRRLHAYSCGIESEEARWAIERDEQDEGGLEKPDEGFPVDPEAFDPEALPVLVMSGGE